MDRVYTKKLKIALSSNYFLYLILGITALYCFVQINIFPKTSKLTENASKIEGKITSYEWLENNKLKLEMKISEENLLAYYSYQEKEMEEIHTKIMVGAKISIIGHLEKPSANSIPNLFSYQTYLKTKNIFYIFQIDKITFLKKGNLWYQMKEWVRRLCEKSQNSAYLKKIILGISDTKKKRIFEIYQKNGISHVFAISGMHFYLLYYLIYKSTKKRCKKESYALPITFLVLSIYYFFLTPSISSRRAYILMVLESLNKIFHLKVSKKKLYGYNLAINLWKNPYILFATSFYYSFLLSYAFAHFASKKKSKSKRIIENGIMIFLFSLPITIANSYSMNPWSIINNILWIPVITGILFPLLVLNFFLPVLDNLISGLLLGIEGANEWLSSLPLTDITMPKIPCFLFIIYYFFLFLLFSFQKKYIFGILGIFLCLWKISPKLNSNGYIYFLDVGQGDCALVISPYQKEVILIDTGPESEYIKDNLLLFFKSLGITNINLLVLSHGDSDHLGNAFGLLENISIEKILLNQGENNKKEQEIKKKYSQKIVTSYQPRIINVTILEQKEKQTENQNSIILHLCLFQTCSLFMGDADREVEKEILTKYQINASVLKVGHHGSQTSTSEDLLEKIPFKTGIISAGRNNRYNHPNETVVERLNRHHLKIYNTQQDGTITLKMKKKGFTILTTPP